MYAVVKTGGKQLKVEVGETISVELLHADTGAVVTLPVLLLNDGENFIVGADAVNATVSAEVLGHGKADKVVAFKFKKRKGYKKNKGHRQALTLLKVTDIALPGAKPAKAAKPEAAAVAEKPIAEKPAAKKPAVKKADAAEKPAVKKPAAAKAASRREARGEEACRQEGGRGSRREEARGQEAGCEEDHPTGRRGRVVTRGQV